MFTKIGINDFNINLNTSSCHNRMYIPDVKGCLKKYNVDRIDKIVNVV